MNIMKVFVLIEQHNYPDIDGGNEARGVYSSSEKAEAALEKIRPEVEYYLGSNSVDVTHAYELIIEEFEMELS